jgi:hypothetical protein
MKIVWYGALAAQAARVQAAAGEERLKFNFLREVVQENQVGQWFIPQSWLIFNRWLD